MAAVAERPPQQAQAVSRGRGGTSMRDRHGSHRSDPGTLTLPSRLRHGFVCCLAGAPVIYSLWFGLKQEHGAGNRWMSVPVPFIPLPPQAHGFGLIIRQGGRI